MQPLDARLDARFDALEARLEARLGSMENLLRATLANSSSSSLTPPPSPPEDDGEPMSQSRWKEMAEDEEDAVLRDVQKDAAPAVLAPARAAHFAPGRRMGRRSSTDCKGAGLIQGLQAYSVKRSSISSDTGSIMSDAPMRVRIRNRASNIEMGGGGGGGSSRMTIAEIKEFSESVDASEVVATCVPLARPKAARIERRRLPSAAFSPPPSPPSVCTCLLTAG